MDITVLLNETHFSHCHEYSTKGGVLAGVRRAKLKWQFFGILVVQALELPAQ